jgi:hypothetical protein
MSDGGLGDIFETFEGTDMTDAARPPTPAPDPNMQFVDTVIDMEEGIASPEKYLFDTAQGMGQMAADAADGRPLTDLAAKGATEVLDGNPGDNWNKIRPDDASPVDDAAGSLAMASEQFGLNTAAQVAPGGVWKAAHDVIVEERQIQYDLEHRPPPEPTESTAYDEDALVSPLAGSDDSEPLDAMPAVTFDSALPDAPDITAPFDNPSDSSFDMSASYDDTALGSDPSYDEGF